VKERLELQIHRFLPLRKDLIIAETYSFVYLWITFTILYFLNRDGDMKDGRLIPFQGNKISI